MSVPDICTEILPLLEEACAGGPVTEPGQYVSYGGWDTVVYEGDDLVDGRFFPDATANVKGPWQVAVASTPFAVRHLTLSLQQDFAGSPSLLDVAIGPAGSEVVLIENLITVGNGYGDAFPGTWQLPVDIPAGTAISARAQTPSGLQGIYASFGLGPLDYRDPRIAGTFITYGADVATSLGVNVEPGGAAYTFSPWVEITPATTEDHYELIVALFANDDELIAPRSFRAQVGAGAAGSETVIVNELLVGGSLHTDKCGKNWRLPVAIPAGTRLALRAEVNTATDGDRDLYAILYGVS